jgi:hypothetical protein
MSPLVAEARRIAERAHQGQVRKARGEPYFSHLEAVAGLLTAHGHADDVTLAAAYLHDVVEDKPAFTHEMVRSMPPEVVETVRALTEPKQDSLGTPLIKARRFDAYVLGLSSDTEAARRALPVSCADKIHNTLSIVEAEAAGSGLLMTLKTRPGEHRLQLRRLRLLYAPAVNASLLAAFDEAVGKLISLVEAWFPGRAALIAAEAHLGQFDKAGAPYVFHPMHLAMQTSDIRERTVALLHDVVEDSRFTLDTLEREGCPSPVLRAVDALTRRGAETYDEFIARVARDRLATRVKLLDLAHNSDLSRISHPTDTDRARVEKYRDAIARLQGELEKRSLYVRLTPDSVDRARSFARLPVLRAEHVTLAYRVHPGTLDARWIPGGRKLGELVEVTVAGELADELVQLFVVEIGSTRARPSDGGVLHLTVSRSTDARSRDSNALLATGVVPSVLPAKVSLEGVVEWVDD